jgi:hypothetical protein
MVGRDLFEPSNYIVNHHNMVGAGKLAPTYIDLTLFVVKKDRCIKR